MSSIDFLNLEYIFKLIYNLFFDADKYKTAAQTFLILWPTIRLLSIFISVGLMIWITYSVIRIYQIRKEEKIKLEGLTEKALLRNQSEPKNERWAQLENHINSAEESNWRLAIIEADIILGEMMTKMGYTQETIGDKLKSVEKSDFNTIDKAWEAHKFRNSIAHEGAKLAITKREADRIIELYKDVFKEFEYL